MAYFLRSKHLDISTGGAGAIAIVNEEEAEHYGINAGDKVSLVWSKTKKITATVDLSNKMVKPGEIGLFQEIWQKKGIEDGDIAEVALESRSLSIETLKKKMLGQPVTYDEIYALIKDISDGKLGQIETTYYAASSFVHPYSEDELYYLAKAMAETGDQFNLREQVADKHSVGGLAGNRTTPIIVPIVASLGICVPNTSSRAITSPAGTADMMEVLCPVSFQLDEIKKIIKKTKTCLVWGGGLKLAPADDKIIKVSRPLALEPYDKMIVSIMAKKVATGVDYLLIDIPICETCKVPKVGHARMLTDKFVKLGKRFGMKVQVMHEPAHGPIGCGIGPALEARDVLRVVQRHKFRPLDLEKKAVRQAAALIELSGYCKPGQGLAIAKQQLNNGEAWKKLNQVIVTQGGKDNINSEEVMQEIQRYEIHASRNGKIDFVNNRAINEVCMNLGAPLDKFSGIHTHVAYGENVKKDQKLYTMYAATEERLKLGILSAQKNVIYHIG